MINFIKNAEFMCGTCPLIFCTDWEGEYECECGADPSILISEFSRPVPDNCPLKSGNIVITIVSGKIHIYKKTGGL